MRTLARPLRTAQLRLANRVKASHRLGCLEQNTAADLDAAVGSLFQRVQRLPPNAVGVDDVNPLGDLAVGGAHLAEFETLVAIDRSDR
jgi:hypothetical protein